MTQWPNGRLMTEECDILELPRFGTAKSLRNGSLQKTNRRLSWAPHNLEPGMTAFDDQPTLRGDTLQLRPLRADDFDGLYAAANSPETWAGHPATERYRREVFEPYFQFLVQAGGCLLILDRHTGEAIGCSRYYPVPDLPADIGIGFTFINHRYWGGATNRELKTLMLGHAFQHFVSA